MMCIDVDAVKVYEIIMDNDKFISPFSEPYGYYIWILNQDSEITIDKNLFKLYLGKLQYAEKTSDILINQAFYMSQSKIDLPKDMWQNLIFESFVLFLDEEEVGCYLSNPDFMTGHYIECRWDFNWNLLFTDYC